MKFNLNDRVRVKLTDTGRRIHRLDHDKYSVTCPKLTYFEPETDEQGWSTFQLWDLMKLFGSHIYMGMPELPFETGMELLHDQRTTPHPETWDGTSY